MPDVFVEKGKDILLDGSKHISLDTKTEFVWKFNDTRIAKMGYNQNTIFFDPFDGRATLYKNYSLLLKDLRLNESGTYGAFLSKAKDIEVNTYKVIVEGTVTLVFNYHVSFFE